MVMFENDWIFNVILPQSGWKAWHIGNISLSNSLPPEMFVTVTVLSLFRHSNPRFYFLHQAPKNNPIHSCLTSGNLCTNARTSKPMPRQLHWWLQHPCLKALRPFQIWWFLVGGAGDEASFWVKETQFEMLKIFWWYTHNVDSQAGSWITTTWLETHEAWLLQHLSLSNWKKKDSIWPSRDH